jgi:hypothetical protein
MDRQRLVGWILIAWSVGYLVYLFKARLFVEGPPLDKKEWAYFWMSFGGIFLGTINGRMAAARSRRSPPPS